jgi:hypothetical protein
VALAIPRKPKADREIGLVLPVGCGISGLITLAPFATAVWIDRSPAFKTARQGWYPSLGLGALTVFDVLRFDVARGLRNGRWTFGVDIGRDFWSVL